MKQPFTWHALDDHTDVTEVVGGLLFRATMRTTAGCVAITMEFVKASPLEAQQFLNDFGLGLKRSSL